VCGGGVIAEHVGDRIDERAFAVGTGAIDEDKNVLGGFAGTAVAAPALQEGLQLLLVISHPIKKCRPQRMRCPGWSRVATRLFGDVIQRVRIVGNAGAEVIGCHCRLPPR